MNEFESSLRKIVREEVRAALADHAPAPTHGKSEFVNTEDVAERTGLSVSTLVHYRQTGEGPPFIKVNRRIVYQVSDIEAWMRANRRGV